MINEENGFNEDSTQEISTATTQAAGEIQNLIGPAIQQTVSQYHGLLRQGLEREVQRIVQEFEAATADIESSITKRIKSRMMDLVNDEVRRVFDDALSSAESALIGPARNLEIISRRPPISQVPQERAPQPPIEQAPIEQVPIEHAPSRETHSPDNPDDDDDGGGGSRVNAFWTPQDNQGPESSSESIDQGPVPVPVHPSANEHEYQENDVQIAPNLMNVEPVIPAEDEVYEGTVRLNVEANGCIRQVVHFVRELRQKPELRLLRLVGNNKEGVDILIGLREPLLLKKMIPQIEGVTIISTSLGSNESGSERLLNVRLVPEEDKPYSPWIDVKPLNATDRVVA
ncbi:MAG: hypothetical protein IIC84_02860 [Chloroflexi bacterium]|nr:hypothetical protein [Chloroflexota bacterium]